MFREMENYIDFICFELVVRINIDLEFIKR